MMSKKLNMINNLLDRFDKYKKMISDAGLNSKYISDIREELVSTVRDNFVNGNKMLKDAKKEGNTEALEAIEPTIQALFLVSDDNKIFEKIREELNSILKFLEHASTRIMQGDVNYIQGVYASEDFVWNSTFESLKNANGMIINDTDLYEWMMDSFLPFIEYIRVNRLGKSIQKRKYEVFLQTLFDEVYTSIKPLEEIDLDKVTYACNIIDKRFKENSHEAPLTRTQIDKKNEELLIKKWVEGPRYNEI